MRLLSCYIAGFGKIMDYSYDFTEGLNTIYEENGWGKTTFSVFIKAMFYGMEYSPRKKELSEREHYLPWDTASYGGNLVFESGDKTYRIERSFGKNNKNDTFHLIDVVTGKESLDYSERIGEELFEVDRDSFEKSIFIPQEALNTTMTDSLNAKMGDLSSAKDDVNNFDLAMNRVEDARRNYTRNSKVNPGQLLRIRQEIRDTNELLEQLPALTDGYEKKRQLIDDKRRELRKLEQQKEVVAEQIRKQSKNEQQLGAYREKKELLDREQKTVTELDDFFSNGIPDMEEQAQIEEREQQLAITNEKIQAYKARLPENNKITLWNRLFARERVVEEIGVDAMLYHADDNQGEAFDQMLPSRTTAVDCIPTEEDINEWTKQATRLSELRIQGKHSQMSEENKQQLTDLKYYFKKKQPTNEEMEQLEADVTKLATLDGKISEVEARYQAVLMQESETGEDVAASKNPGAVIAVMIICLALLIGGVALQMVSPEGVISPLAILCVVAAVVIAVVFLVRSRKRTTELRQNRQEHQRHIETNRRQMEQYHAEREELSRKCKTFLGDFLVTPTESMAQMVQEIRRKLDIYERLLAEEEKNLQDTTGTLDELAEVQLQLYTALQSYAEAYDMDLYHDACERELLDELKVDAVEYSRYVELCKEMQEAKSEADGYREEIRKYVMRFPVAEQLTTKEMLLEIRKNIQKNEASGLKLAELMAEIAAFEQEYQVDANVESVEKLQEKQLALDAQIAELNQVITVDRDSLSVLAEKLETCEDAESNLENLQERLEECEAKVHRLEQTGEFLQAAKEQFLSKYMGPLQNSLHKYLDMLSLDSDQVQQFGLDMDLSIRFMHQGRSKERDYLSRGYKDLAALCSRFALLDVLYHKEQPMIVLDDPFTNFDEEKLASALELLQEIAKDRQVIYYTCHESRVITEEV